MTRAIMLALLLSAGCSKHSATTDGGDVPDASAPFDGGLLDASMPDGATRTDGGGVVDQGPASELTFETGPVRPVAVSADGSQVFVVNIPDGYLEILSVSTSGLKKTASVAVGMEPVAVAVRTPTEVWVVNQLSDSVSIVDLSASPPRVVRTLLVGDEPSDLVFGGTSRNRAFITTAHRGQRRTDAALSGVPGAGDPQLTTASVGRADVWVFDATSLGADAGGVPLSILTFAGDTPRALAVTPDGSTVYAAVFKSGNQTTATTPELACSGFDSDTPCTISGNTIPGSPAGPGTNHAGVTAPVVATIVKQNSAGKFLDSRNRDWSGVVKFTLPDTDVFSINASTLAAGSTYAHVGTTLFNMAVNPVSGHVYVSNTEARNDLRFEGPGTYAGTTLQGHLAESQVTVISGSTVTPHHLNSHIDYATLPAPAGTADHSLATPVDLVTSADGTTLYVAAFGSGKVGVLPTAALEAGTLDPTTASAGYLAVTGGGPGGLSLDDTHKRLFVATRFDDGISMIDLATKTEVSHVTLHTPESQRVIAGRPFLYDALKASSNGEAACASCHMFGDMDQLAWNLGNPDADVITTPVTIKLAVGAGSKINGTGDPKKLHPMKGPMTTQTLRGLVNHGAMHWRGDRVTGFFGTDTATSPPYDSELAFKNFILAFQSLVGRGTMFDTTDMQTFTDFALRITMPPNPNRAIDNSLTTSQANGRAFYMGCVGNDSTTGNPVQCTNGVPTGTGHLSDGVSANGFGFSCNGCHVLDAAQGFFGTDGSDSFEALPQINKVPQLRNLYTKVGMFGLAATPVQNAGDNGNKGAQVRGFGFENDGSTDTIFRFLQANVFNASGNIGFTGGDAQRRDVEQFLLAYDNDLAPVVGQQITLSSTDDGSAAARIATLVARAMTPFVSKILGGTVTECDLTATGVAGGKQRAYLLAGGMFTPDGPEAALSPADLEAQAKVAGQALTFTCTVPGWGGRILDRDNDGFANSVDMCPDDPSCH